MVEAGQGELGGWPLAPPKCPLRSKTVTATPRCARVMAAARPLGPEPTMLAERKGMWVEMRRLAWRWGQARHLRRCVCNRRMP